MNDLVLFGKLIVNGLAMGSLGVAAWAAYNALEKKWPNLAKLKIKEQRPLLGVICAVLVSPVFWFATVMYWLPTPPDWRGWVAQIGTYALLAYAFSQETHGFEKDAKDAKKAALGVQ